MKTHFFSHFIHHFSMAEGPTPLLPLLFSFLLFLSFDNEVLCFENKAVLSLQKFQWPDLKHVSKCFPQKARQERGATILEMKQRDYCSGHIKNWDETIQNRLISDDRRVQSLQTQVTQNTNEILGRKGDLPGTQIPLSSGLTLQILNYIVTVQLGGKEMIMIVDTGSDLTWVQCQPCVSCYEQQDPVYNPSISRSYQSITCNSSTCQSLSSATGNSGVCPPDHRTCDYFLSYGDGSYTSGQLARESLNLSSVVVPKFIFGCGRDNKGLFGGTSGLMGLGRSQLSLITQTSTRFKGMFSYCLPSTDTGASGSLTLGGNFSVFKNETPIVYTNMIQIPQLSSFYLLNLTGMSIGGVALKAPGFAKGGIIIDSGTVITRLTPSVYRALKTEFLKQFSGYMPAPPASILDTCFNLTAYEEVNVPTMKFWFENKVEMTVDVMGMFYFATTDASQVCLAVASLENEDGIPIIGNYQQRNLRVIYDTRKGKVGFAKEVCSYS